MPAHPLQAALDDIDSEWATLEREFAARLAELRQKRQKVLDQIASDVTPSTPEPVGDVAPLAVPPPPLSDRPSASIIREMMQEGDEIVDPTQGPPSAPTTTEVSPGTETEPSPDTSGEIDRRSH